MKIKHISIENYRSIKDLDLDISDFSILIGANNSGKSNILKALNYFFQSSEKISSEDVFAFFEGSKAVVSVTVTFDSLTDQEKITYKKYLLNDYTIKVTKACQVERDDLGEIIYENPAYHGFTEAPDRWYLTESVYDRLNTKEKIKSEVNSNPELAPLLEIEGRFTKEVLREFQDNYIKENRSLINYSQRIEDTQFLGKSTVATGILPDFIFIPAVRDISDETKINSKTLLGKLLLNTLEIMNESDSEFREAILKVEKSIKGLNDKNSIGAPIGKLENELSDELASWGVKTSIDVTPPSITKLFELGTSLYLDDGVKTGAESKGHGLQRALIFSFLKVIANHNRINSNNPTEVKPRSGSNSIIYAIEEAEIYLHPHKQREFYTNLKKISEDENTQVLLTTHSSHFVRMDDYMNLVLISKPSREAGTIKAQCCDNIFDPISEVKNRYKLAHYINPDNGEMFFARKVVLVEGETEKVVIPYLAERLGLYKTDISIIDCGSKFNLPLYIKLLNYFKIPYVVIFDEDPMKSSYGNPDKEKSARNTYEANKEIEKATYPDLGICKMLSPDFEGHFGLPKSDREKGFRALKHFQTIRDELVPESMIQLLSTIYS